MKNEVHLDESGVPQLSARYIELKAEEVISYFGEDRLKHLSKIPVRDFVDKLSQKFNIEKSYSRDLGHTKNRHKILGTTRLKPKGIFVDASLEEDSRFNFVLSHELGHLVLHRSIDLKKTGYADQEMVDTKIDLVTGKKVFQTAREWIEWQANKFASALLMPRESMILAVMQKQKEIEQKRNRGRIFLENKPYSILDYRRIQGYLAELFDVNHTNIECRLKDLGILIDRRGKDVKHISELLATE